jgi:Histidine kinase-, DNA gyrase B-, and HSP90-like ATPase
MTKHARLLGVRGVSMQRSPRTARKLRSLDITSVGTKLRNISVTISPQIIKHFSEGLYTNPHKAIEELVVNGFDAGASRVDVLLHDTSDESGNIVVLDDGWGMDDSGLEQHWVVGDSEKTDDDYDSPEGREPIGQFGIGKLSTYVLAEQLTHLSKRGNAYYAATMDYRRVNTAKQKGTIALPVRRVSIAEAQAALGPYLELERDGVGLDYLFGRKAPKTWTAAILTDLRPLADQIYPGPLTWRIATAMPLRSDFAVYLNGRSIHPAKQDAPRIETWRLGRDFIPKLPDFERINNTRLDEDEPKRFGLRHPILGEIYGEFALFVDPLTGGKSSSVGRSNGFFVYVRSRLLNEDEPYFGIPENALRHGTMARFTMRVEIDALNKLLRASRESVLEGPQVVLARELMRDAFNVARDRLDREQRGDRGLRGIAERFADSPKSVSTRPLLSLAERVFTENISPRMSRFDFPTDRQQRSDLLADLYKRAEEGHLLRTTSLRDNSPDDPLCVLDVASGDLAINRLHPFVGYFLDSFEDKKHGVPLELFSTAEMMLEAMLYTSLDDDGVAYDLITRRDTLLRYMARAAGRRTPAAVAQRLLESLENPVEMELALVEAFATMGFSTTPLGGGKKPDGVAEAIVSPTQDEQDHVLRRSYKVSLEAKSKPGPRKVVDNENVRVSTVRRHRKHFGCQHAIVVGPRFADRASSSLLDEVEDENRRCRIGPDRHVWQTITLAEANDIARLTRLVPVKLISLHQLRELFYCQAPRDVRSFVNALEAQTPPQRHFVEIVRALAMIQREDDAETIDYGQLKERLRSSFAISLSKSDIAIECRALQTMTGELVTAHVNTVELNQDPQLVLDAIRDSIRELPGPERKAALSLLDPAPNQQIRPIMLKVQVPPKRSKRSGHLH